MACSLTTISRIDGLSRLTELIEDSEDEDIVDRGFGCQATATDGWDDAWGMNDANLKGEPKASNIPSWLQSTLISISPLEEFIVVAKNDKGVFFSKKWPSIHSSTDELPFYEISWSGNLSSTDEDIDQVTCIKCVPLASQQRSSGGRPDWTCVICGFLSGYIRIFMTNGTLLLAQYLHNGPVVNIKLKTKATVSTTKDFSEQAEELFILYPNALVTIDGFSLYQSLRACRNQLARAQASMSVEIDPPPLAYHKWRIEDQERIKDVGGCGITTPCLFDRLQTASFTTGFNALVKGSAPAFHHFFTAGKEPFLGVYQALEGSSQPIMSDVALAVASKLTSAVLSRLSAAKGWWSGGGTQESSSTAVKEKKLPKVEIGTSLGHRLCLQDKRRFCENIYLAPTGHLAAVTDTYNRIVLFDTSKGIVVRMWKGYREAECGWIVVKEEDDTAESSSSSEAQKEQNELSMKRKALFLVIYAPKRGIIEIYLMENGNRVGAFNVGKNCKLLYPGYLALGQTIHHHLKSYDMHQCFLLQSDGVIKSIQVPFHCALSSVHSILAKDQHLLKKISNMVEKSYKPEKGTEICKLLVDMLLDIQVPSSQKKGIENILKTQGLMPEFVRDCLKGFLNQLQEKESNDSNEDIEFLSEREDLVEYCKAHLQLVDMFFTIMAMNEDKEGADSELMDQNDVNKEEDALSDLLHIDLQESEKILRYINKYRGMCLDEGDRKVVERRRGQTLSITSFIQCFQIEIADSCNTNSSSTKTSSLDILDNLAQPEEVSLGSFLFEGALHALTPISKLSLALESSGIPPKQYMALLTAYTQSKNCCNILHLPEIYQLHSLVASICSLKDGPEKAVAELPVGKSSDWWDSVRNVLIQSSQIGTSYLMSIICRGVAIELNMAAHKINKLDEVEILTGSWEPIMVDMERWNFLVSQLENLLELDCFVHSNHAVIALSGTSSPSFAQHEHSPKGSKFKSQCAVSSSPRLSDRLPTLSVQGVLDGGYGAFAEIVSDVLVRQGVPGPCIGPPKPKQCNVISSSRCFENEDEEPDDIPEDTYEEEEELDAHEISPALLELRAILPFSLDHDVLWVHCAWESIMVWNEDVEDIAMLSTALIHLTCIHNPILQQGLAVLMWKTVYKESIKAFLSLAEKVGKAPKERLCKQTVNLGYKAMENFLYTSKQLIEMLMDIDITETEKPEFKSEVLWERKCAVTNKLSIVEQAAEEPFCNLNLLKHYWCLITTLYLIMHGGMKSVKPLSLFDTKGKHAFVQPFHADPLLSTELDTKVTKARETFCCNAVMYIINDHIALTCQDDMLRHNTTELLKHMNIVLDLAKGFKSNDDLVRQFISCELYSAGLDIAGQEMAMLVQDKGSFTAKILEVIGQRLAKSLLEGDMTKVSTTLSKLPTYVTTWLESIDRSKLRVPSIPLTNTFLLLQYINTNFAQDSKDFRFINELIESLKVFL